MRQGGEVLRATPARGATKAAGASRRNDSRDFSLSRGLLVITDVTGIRPRRLQGLPPPSTAFDGRPVC